MHIRWPKFFVSYLRRISPRRTSRKNDLAPVGDLHFRRRPQSAECFDRTAGQPRRPGVYATWPGQQPYLRSWSEDFKLPLSEIPALTITANTGRISHVGAARPEWWLRFLAYGDGSSETGALDRSRQFSVIRTGSTIYLNGPRVEPKRECGTQLEVSGPANAPITIHLSFGWLQVCDMGGPVHVSAIHGRTSILNTTGIVAATGFVVDYAGSEGTVTLSAEAEINVKFSSARFDGTMMAWSQGPLRVLVPRGFRTPFQAFVNRPRDFACRTEFRKKIRHERQGALHVFTYPGDGIAAPEKVHLRSEHGTVVIDDTLRQRRSPHELREAAFEDYT
jgi:hypothetical protein